jgi:hypothetical protein
MSEYYLRERIHICFSHEFVDTLLKQKRKNKYDCHNSRKMTDFSIVIRETVVDRNISEISNF